MNLFILSLMTLGLEFPATGGLEQCVNRVISKYQRQPQWKLIHQEAEAWKVLAFDEVARDQWVYVNGTLGKATAVELFPGYRAIILEHPNSKQAQMIGEDRLREIKAVPRSLTDDELKTARKRFKESDVDLDHKKLHDHICELKRKHESHPHFKALQRIADRAYQNSPQSFQFSAAACPAAVVVTAYFKDEMDESFRPMANGKELKRGDDWISKHGSNFWLGTLYMSAAHNCLNFNPAKETDSY